MALSIKAQEADRLARELAAETHESITEAVTVALRERLVRVRSLPGPDIVHAGTTTLTTLDALRSLQIELTSFDEAQFELGLRAWRRFGKGRHPAAFNFGDCFTYALAKVTGLPILCVGKDFAQANLATLTPPTT